MKTKAEKSAELHRTSRIGWLRASVLGANDGILSTGSLIVGVAAAHSSHQSILIAGVASLVAGAMSMAAGEYVSVSSQSDTEDADIALERAELRANPKGERRELAEIYVGRGLDPALADQVAAQLMARDALGAHARDELGILPEVRARPVQAAIASAISFSVGATFPLALGVFAPPGKLIWIVSVASLFFLGFLGALAARAGGASVAKGAARVTFWGALAMGVTALIGHLSRTLL
jgi:VIT1/CCC1 family predicted Fe2+/Mn2+ transporter